jgi:hypothetical protein
MDQRFAKRAVGDDKDTNHVSDDYSRRMMPKFILLGCRKGWNALADAAQSRGSDGGFEGVEEHSSHVETGLLGDLLKAGGAGHVHLGQPIADHVEPDEQ